MAYEHRGLIIGISQRLLYVLPIYSYKAEAHKNPPLHIKDNPTGKSNFYLLKKDEFSFLKHDSVIKLNDLRTVSNARIKYAHNASISPSTETNKFIENQAFRHYFPLISYDYDTLKTNYESLLEQIAIKEEQIEKLQQQIIKLTKA